MLTYNCAACGAWRPTTQAADSTKGRCQLIAPVAKVVLVPVRTVQGDGLSAQVITVWPETEASDFCLDFVLSDESENSDIDPAKIIVQ
jgi:hypothetical protein